MHIKKFVLLTEIFTKIWFPQNEGFLILIFAQFFNFFFFSKKRFFELNKAELQYSLRKCFFALGGRVNKIDLRSLAIFCFSQMKNKYFPLQSLVTFFDQKVWKKFFFTFFLWNCSFFHSRVYSLFWPKRLVNYFFYIFFYEIVFFFTAEFSHFLFSNFYNVFWEKPCILRIKYQAVRNRSSIFVEKKLNSVLKFFF